MTVQVLDGHCLDVLRTLPAGSVHCCVTSPPYYALRDYGVDGQIGLEDTPAEFIAALVDVFREVRRVLRDDGTLWMNLGDSYAGTKVTPSTIASQRRDNAPAPTSAKACAGWKPKDLMGIPWRVAFALQDDGWWLRQDIIWNKPNPMPESIRDRCTKAHEYVFLLAKSERYHFDFEAFAEPRASEGVQGVAGWASGEGAHDTIAHNRDKGDAKTFRGGRYTKGAKFDNSHASERDSTGNKAAASATRNRRSVWTIPSDPFKGAHFATYPPALVEPCILAGCPPGGTVLDPFGGAGTTGLVADRLQRNAVLIELNPTYAEMARRRIHDDAPLLQGVA